MTIIQFLGEWVVRSSILILAGAMLLWLLRVRNPSVRLAAYTAMLAASLSMPFLVQWAAFTLPGVLPAAPAAICIRSARNGSRRNCSGKRWSPSHT